MSDPDPNSPYGLEIIQRNALDLRVRPWLYGITLFYLAAVSLNAISIVVAFWLRVFGAIDIPYQWLAAWAVGSSGLGAGSFALAQPIKKMVSGPL